MVKQVCGLVVVAALSVSGTAYANAGKFAAEEAVRVMSETKAGVRVLEGLGVKMPENLGKLNESMLKNLTKDLETSLAKRPASERVAIENAVNSLRAQTSGKTGTAKENAAAAVISTNSYTANLIKVQAATSLVGTVKDARVAQEAAKQEVLMCSGMNSIPSAAAGVLAGFKDCGLSAAAQANMIDIAKTAQADNNSANDAIQIAQGLQKLNGEMDINQAKDGAKTLDSKCVKFTDRVSAQIRAM